MLCIGDYRVPVGRDILAGGFGFHKEFPIEFNVFAKQQTPEKCSEISKNIFYMFSTIHSTFDFQGGLKMADDKKSEEATGEVFRKSSEVDTEEECCDSLYRWHNCNHHQG